MASPTPLWLVALNVMRIFSIAIYCWLTRQVGISTVFPMQLTAPLHSPNNYKLPVVRAVQGTAKESTQQFYPSVFRASETNKKRVRKQFAGARGCLPLPYGLRQGLTLNPTLSPYLIVCHFANTFHHSNHEVLWISDSSFHCSASYPEPTSTYRQLCSRDTTPVNAFEQNALQWLHNGCDGVSNHRRLDGLLNSLFQRRPRETPDYVSLAFVKGIHRRSVDSAHKEPVTRKMFPFDGVIMFWRLEWELLQTRFILILILPSPMNSFWPHCGVDLCQHWYQWWKP